MIHANDELFADRENLIKPGAPVFQPHTFGNKGQIMDGWETRRRREPASRAPIVPAWARIDPDREQVQGSLAADRGPPRSPPARPNSPPPSWSPSPCRRGDGTVDAAVAAGLERVPVTVAGPTGEPPRATRRGSGGRRARLRLRPGAAARRTPSPLATSSFGAGQELAAALKAGARQIIFGVGGSASTDATPSLIQALEAQVLGPRSEPLPAAGSGALRDVATLDLTGLHPTCGLLCHPGHRRGNPLTGPDGAAEVYDHEGRHASPVGELATAAH